MKLSASVLATSFIRLSETLASLDEKYIDYIHLDVMDGNFVPPITFGEKMSKEIASATNIPLDVHLMVQNPEKEVEKYLGLQPYCITFHYEACTFPIRLLAEIKKNGICAGIAINPSTPITALQEIIPYLDLVLLMSVEPGYYGQPFLETTWRRLEYLTELKKKYSFSIQVDGGVSLDNIQKLSKNSVDLVAVGSAVFKGDDTNEKARILKKVAATL